MFHGSESIFENVRRKEQKEWYLGSWDGKIAIRNDFRKFYEIKPLGINWDVCRNDYPNTGVEANI
jgi:hypothetical protein